MDNINGFSDSNDISNNSSTCCNNAAPVAAAATETPSSSEPLNPDVPDLSTLSKNLESIVDSPDFDFFSDAKIVLSSGREIPVHRCILAARSGFFKNVFCGKETGVKLEAKELLKDYDVGIDSLLTILGYLYTGKVRSVPKDVCICVDEGCCHMTCRPAVDFMVEVLFGSFTFQISELVALFQRHLQDILDKMAADDILVVLFVANLCSESCEKLLKRCMDIIVKSDVDIVTLEKSLPADLVKRITDLRSEHGLNGPENGNFPDKHVRRVHRALDSDDVELVRMLLKEGHSNLDDAHALHYAVAYCDAKTTTELLDLGLADVNHRNSRGYTVLHVAAMRKQPTIIVSLLTKGAQPSYLTSDGRKALQIAKRLTKAADYFTPTEKGKASHKDRLCIEILEQAERKDPLPGEASHSLAMAGDDLRMKLLYLENRVGLAKLLFPVEAQVAMDIAHVNGTCEFITDGIKYGKNVCDAKRKTMDLNEAPFRMQEEHHIRLKALSRTVELGKRFFPRCSEVLNKIMDAEDLNQLACLGNDAPEERVMKKRRYMELQELLSKAFDEDKVENERYTISSSSSSKLVGLARQNGGKAQKQQRWILPTKQ